MRSFQPIDQANTQVRQHNMKTRSQVKSQIKILNEKSWTTRHNPYAIQYRTPAVKCEPGYFIPINPCNQNGKPDDNLEIGNESKYIKIGNIKRKDNIHGSSNVNYDGKIKRPRGCPRKRAVANDVVVGSSAKQLLKDAMETQSAHQKIVIKHEPTLLNGLEEAKEETEQPPSTPPLKKRRHRHNGSKTLLKEATILDSKLRNTSSRKILPNMQSQITVDENNNVKINSPLPSPEDKSQSNFAEFQSKLDSLKWKFSFEKVPKKETWFRTFSRQEQSPSTFLPEATGGIFQHQNPMVLPYETNLLCHRPQKKDLFPTRKSPRCHSTSATILAALKTRSRKTVRPRSPSTSIAASSLPTGPKTAQSWPLLSESPPQSPKSAQLQAANPNLQSTLPSLSMNPSTSTASFQAQMLSELIPLTRTEDSLFGWPIPLPVGITSPSSSQTTENELELPASQYIWDSLEFLSDPYVVRLLAEDV